MKGEARPSIHLDSLGSALVLSKHLLERHLVLIRIVTLLIIEKLGARSTRVISCTRRRLRTRITLFYPSSVYMVITY